MSAKWYYYITGKQNTFKLANILSKKVKKMTGLIINHLYYDPNFQEILYKYKLRFYHETTVLHTGGILYLMPSVHII